MKTLTRHHKPRRDARHLASMPGICLGTPDPHLSTFDTSSVPVRVARVPGSVEHRSPASKPDAGLRAARIAATLTEVLISLLVMSIGLSGAAALFPLSMVRSIHANQLTVSTQHRYNAEAQLDFLPQLFSDPDNDANVAEHSTERFLVDPLGRATGIDLPDTLGSLARYNGVLARNSQPTLAQADQLVTSTESWKNVHEGVPPAAPAGPNMMGPEWTIDVPGLNNGEVFAGGLQNRFVFFNAAGDNVVMRNLDPALQTPNNVSGSTAFSSTTIGWTGALPANFGTPSLVRVESLERRYTWMLTVRGTGSAGGGRHNFDIDVVLFFRRGLETTDEFVYSNNGGNVFTRPSTAVAGSTEINVTWTPNTDPKPFLKKGGYVLDAANAEWYRILSYTESTGSAKATLDRGAVANSSQAVFFRGVIDVYPIGVKTSPTP